MKGWKLFMKKNVLMRFASGALVITMLTTCVISGTFAKYITDDAASDKARVAKWGITLAVGGSLYGKTYYHGNHPGGANEVTVTDTDADISVYGKQMDTTADDKANRVVAPGTKNDTGFAISLNGTPEVDANATAIIDSQNIFLKRQAYAVMVPLKLGTVTPENLAEIKTQSDNGEIYTRSGGTDLTNYEYRAVTDVDENDNTTQYYTVEDICIDNNTDWTGNVAVGNNYYPVVYSFTGSGTTTYTRLTDDYDTNTVDEIAKLLAGKFDGGVAPAGVPDTDTSTKYTSATGTHIEQNTSVNDVFGLGDQKITWAWTFDPAFDKVDTILGNLIAERANVSGVTNSLAGAANDFDGDVVKLGGADNQTVSQPKEYTDYCLDTRFDITIKVEQVD